MKSRLYTIALITIIYIYSSAAHAVLIGNKDWNQVSDGPYSLVSTWGEMASIFDPITGKCISNLCSSNEYWASASDILELYDIAGPDGLSGFADTFAEPPFTSIVHGVVRDIFIENSLPFITEAVIFCDGMRLGCASPQIFGSNFFSLVDDFSFTQGVYIGVWTYRQVSPVSAPSSFILFGFMFAAMFVASNARQNRRKFI